MHNQPPLASVIPPPLNSNDILAKPAILIFPDQDFYLRENDPSATANEQSINRPTDAGASKMAEGEADDLLKLTAMIVSAHVSKNHVAPDAVASLIHDVHRTLSHAGAPAEQHRDLVPAVPVKKSVYPDYIICLEDGRKLKMLKRHLQTTYNMTPNEYRTKWGLPSDYPMVAPSYAERRSSLAKEIGLGKRPGEGKAAPLKRGRPKKVA